MGKGYHNYMNKKFFHPGSFDNIKRLWMAQQKKEFEDKKEEEKVALYRREQEQLESRAMLGDEKAKLGIAFLYDRPPGADKDEDADDGGGVGQQQEVRFEWQRKYKGPRETYCKGDEEVRDQPFGIEVRNVRCVKCHRWGHMNTDRACPLFGKSITMEPTLPSSTASAAAAETASASIGDARRHMRDEQKLRFTRQAEATGYNEVANSAAAAAAAAAAADDDDSSEAAAFLRSLSDKQRQKLMRKLQDLESSGKERKRHRQRERREADGRSGKEGKEKKGKEKERRRERR